MERRTIASVLGSQPKDQVRTMTRDSFKAWIDVVSAVITLIGGMITALWVYSKYIVERGLIPPTQFSVSCTPLGHQQNMNVLEILVRLTNCGASTLIVGNL